MRISLCFKFFFVILEVIEEEVKRMLQLTIPEIILRLVLAMVMGGAIGFERQYKNRPAGMRTHILVCMGAAIIALIQSQIAINALKDALANPALTGVIRSDRSKIDRTSCKWNRLFRCWNHHCNETKCHRIDDSSVTMDRCWFRDRGGHGLLYDCLNKFYRCIICLNHCQTNYSRTNNQKIRNSLST